MGVVVCLVFLYEVAAKKGPSKFFVSLAREPFFFVGGGAAPAPPFARKKSVPPPPPKRFLSPEKVGTTFFLFGVEERREGRYEKN